MTSSMLICDILQVLFGYYVPHHSLLLSTLLLNRSHSCLDILSPRDSNHLTIHLTLNYLLHD